MTAKEFIELINATKTKTEAVTKSREQAYKKYSDLYNAAVQEKELRTEEKTAASAAGDVEKYEEIRNKLKQLDEDMDLYKVGMRSSGEVKVTDEEYENTVNSLKAGINDYVKEKEKSILSELEKAVNEINAMCAVVKDAKETGMAYCKTIKPEETNNTFSLSSFDASSDYAGLANKIAWIFNRKSK